jgi:hypothetical protein
VLLADCLPTRSIKDAAARWLKKGEPLPDWVFPARQGGLLEERNVRHVFKRLLAKATLRHMRIHDLRHPFASLLLQQGESVVYVKEQLGHGSTQITVDTYGHLIPGANRGAVDRLDGDAPLHLDASQAHPEAYVEDVGVSEADDLLGKSGEPHFRELEPGGGLAAAIRGAPLGSLSWALLLRATRDMALRRRALWT